MKYFKGWTWWQYALAAFVPGGLILAAVTRAISRAAAAGAARDYDLSLNAPAAKTGTIDKLIGSATSSAAALRSGLANDPLAATLLGIDPALIATKVPEAAAVDNAKKTVEREALKKEYLRAQYEVQKALDGWTVDHFGGQSPGEFEGIMARLNGYVSQVAAQLAVLG